ncbi:MAG: hypothetical protein ACOC46_00805 [Pirellulales bacterium]
MFAFPARARRGIALAAFVTACVLPTAYVSYLAWWINRPEHAQVAAGHVRRWLGLDAELAGVGYPRPGQLELRGLVLRDPENQRVVAAVDRLRLRRDDRSLAVTARGVRVVPIGETSGKDRPAPVQRAMFLVVPNAVPDSMASSGATARRLWGALDELLARVNAPDVRQATFRCADLIVDLEEHGYTLRDVAVQYRSQGGRSQTRARFRLAGLEMTTPAELEIHRDKRSGVPQFRIALDTGPTPLPLTLLFPLLDATPWIGADARLQGTVGHRETEEGTVVDLRGRLNGVDLGVLVSRNFAQQMTGLAGMQIDRFRWKNGRVEHVYGSLRAGPGWVGAPFLAALEKELRFTLEEPVPRAGVVPYEQFACSFALAAGAMWVDGRCTSAAADAVMTSRKGVLLRHPPRQVPLVGLVRALAPQTGLFVPASLETDSLMRVLPLPSVRRVGREVDAARTALKPADEPPRRLPESDAAVQPNSAEYPSSAPWP